MVKKMFFEAGDLLSIVNNFEKIHFSGKLLSFWEVESRTPEKRKNKK